MERAGRSALTARVLCVYVKVCGQVGKPGEGPREWARTSTQPPGDSLVTNGYLGLISASLSLKVVYLFGFGFFGSSLHMVWDLSPRHAGLSLAVV